MTVFRDSLNYFWTAQTSQIYRELQTLKKNGWVEDVVVPQQGKPSKNVFSITTFGKEELLRWLEDDCVAFDTKVPILMKVFFRGELPVTENIDFFKKIKQTCQRSLEQMSQPNQNVKMYAPSVPSPTSSLYWKMTVNYGVMYAQMLIEWCDACIKMLEETYENISD